MASESEIIEALKEASKVTRLPFVVLHALAKAESNLNPLAKSPAGAMGLMQIMPIVVKNFNVKNPYNIKENTLAGAKLLKSYHRQVKGDWVKTIASYNWGLTNIKNNPNPNKWPKETINHVKKVMKFAKNYFAAYI